MKQLQEFSLQELKNLIHEMSESTVLLVFFEREVADES